MMRMTSFNAEGEYSYCSQRNITSYIKLGRKSAQ